MRSIITVITPPAGPELVTLDEVKLEFGITDTTSDDLLNVWIREVSQLAASYCQQVLVQQTVSEVFRHSVRSSGPGFYHGGFGIFSEQREGLILRTDLLRSVTSVNLDGTNVPTSQFEHDDSRIYRLNSSGFPCSWNFSKSITVVYVSGFLVGVDVPGDLQRAVMMLIREVRGIASRVDPTLKSRETVGVSRLEWWVPSTPTTSLSIEITGLLDQYKRPWEAFTG